MEYLFVSNGMRISGLLRLTKGSCGLIGLAVNEFLILRDGGLECGLGVGHDEGLDHAGRLPCFHAFPILRRCGDEVLHVALLAELRRMSLKRRRISSSV